MKTIFLNYLFDMIGFSGYKLNLKLAESIIKSKGHAFINLENGQIISSYSPEMLVAKITPIQLKILNDLTIVSVSDIENLSIKYKDNKDLDLIFNWAKVLAENLMGHKFKSFLTIDL